MKKLLAIVLAMIMIVPIGILSTSAAETIVSQTCSYTYTGRYIDPQTGKVLYPDSETDPKLTDGIIGAPEDVVYSGKVWIGMNINSIDFNKMTFSNYILLDLGEQKQKLSKFCLYTLNCDAGIEKPTSVKIYISEDNVDFIYAGTMLNEKIVDSLDSNESYGIYAYTLTLSKAYSARYVKFEIQHYANWVFVSEAEVYQNPDLPDAPVTNYSLISYNKANWISGPQGGETASASISNNSVVISGSSNSSPYAYYDIKNTAKVNIADYSIIYDFTVTGGDTNIVLFCEGSTCESGTNYISDITHLMAAEGSPQRPSGDNLKAGTYKGKIKISDLNYGNVSIKESGKITFTSIKIFSINGGVITLNKLKLEPTIPELDINGLDSQGICYYIDKMTNTAIISRANRSIAGSIVLSDKVSKDGIIYPVICIGNDAFADCDYLTEVIIPDGYLSLNAYVFKYCDSLKKVSLPASLSGIAGNPFFQCPKISEIIIDKNNDNYLCEDNVIFNKSKTALIVYPAGKTDSEYTIPDSVNTICDNAFNSAQNLTKVNIPGSIKELGCGAFSLSGLYSVSIPDGVVIINNEAFSCCPKLNTVSISKSVNSINNNAFENCYSLKGFKVDKDNSNYSSSNGILFSKNGEVINIYPAGITDSSYTIPSNVKSIGMGAFQYNEYLKSVTVPDSVSFIASSAFYNCKALSNITFPDSLIRIIENAFLGTEWYNNQPDGVVYAGKMVYKYKGYIPENATMAVITLQEGTKGISPRAFSDCNMSSINIPDSVTEIGIEAFANCNKIKNIILPESVTHIGTGVFMECQSLESIKLSNNIKEIPGLAFLDCQNLTNVIIPKSVIKIFPESFIGCTKIKLLVYENSYAINYAIQYNIPYEIIKETIPGLTFENGFVSGLTENLTGNDITAKFGCPITIKDSDGKTITDNTKVISTGSVIVFNGTDYTVIVKGDLNGDAVIDSIDCLLIKKAIIGNGTLEGAYFKAACINEADKFDSADYLRIKKYVIGTLDSLN